MLCKVAAAGAIAGVMSFASASFAGVILQESHAGVVALQSTDWVDALSVPQFDDMDGARELVSIGVFIDGSVSGSAGIESMDQAPTTIAVELSAEISLSLGDAVLGVVLPIADDSFNATGYDGSIDFGGTSGRSFAMLTASDVDDILLTAADDVFIDFLGSGDISLTGKALGTSFGSGSGNLVLEFSTQAAMAYRINYNFVEVPTPGSIAVIACCSGLLGTRRRR